MRPRVTLYQCLRGSLSPLQQEVLCFGSLWQRGTLHGRTLDMACLFTLICGACSESEAVSVTDEDLLQ